MEQDLTTEAWNFVLNVGSLLGILIGGWFAATRLITAPLKAELENLGKRVEEAVQGVSDHGQELMNIVERVAKLEIKVNGNGNNYQRRPRRRHN